MLVPEGGDANVPNGAPHEKVEPAEIDDNNSDEHSDQVEIESLSDKAARLIMFVVRPICFVLGARQAFGFQDRRLPRIR